MIDENVFAKIIAGEIPAEVLFEEDDLIVIKDIKPKAPVHYLVVPRKEIRTINDSREQDAQLLGRMILAGKKAARKLGIDDGYKLVFNVEAKGGQVIPHIHLHVLGGWQDGASE
ncbi:MAG: histidine triad nucleotide-binding protein [Candidatus Spechtbacterales bacterium]